MLSLEIQQLLVDYSTAIDQHRSDHLDKVFAPDAYIDLQVAKRHPYQTQYGCVCAAGGPASTTESALLFAGIRGGYHREQSLASFDMNPGDDYG